MKLMILWGFQIVGGPLEVPEILIIVMIIILVFGGWKIPQMVRFLRERTRNTQENRKSRGGGSISIPNGSSKEQSAEAAMRKMMSKDVMATLQKEMGKDEFNKMYGDLGQINQVLTIQTGARVVEQNGADAIARILSIEDTGKSVDMNRIVMMSLKIIPSSGGAEIQTDAVVILSRFPIPRVGDSIKIRYNTENPSQVAVL